MARDELELAYEAERDYLHSLGEEFGRLHPKIAARLRLGQQGSTDPHVERLIDAVAFLNARVRRKLDDDLPELTDALLGFVQPQQLLPFPSATVLRFECDAGLTAPYEVKRGTHVDTEPVEGEPIRFKTCYRTLLHPIRVAAATLIGAQAARTPGPFAAQSRALLRIVLESRGEVPLAALLFPKSGDPAAARLRFFLRGEPALAHELHQLLLNDALELSVAAGPADPRPQRLPPSAIAPVGFAEDEALLPVPARAHPAHRLLGELFHFPAKFLFVEFSGFERAKVAECGKRLELQVLLRRAAPKSEAQVDASCFALGCTPAVNLFTRRAEPIRLAAGEHEYRVVPDARRARALEVWSLDRVTAAAAGMQPQPYLPLHGLEHDTAPGDRGRFWLGSRRPTARATASERGSDFWISLIDLDGAPAAPADWVLDLETTCFQRDLPALLPFGGGQPRLRFAEGGGPVPRLECLLAPTATRRPTLRDGQAWRLVSQLQLNHLSLDDEPSRGAAVHADGGEGSEAFRELLRLHDHEGREEVQEMIRGVVAVRRRPVTLRVEGGGAPGLVRGHEVTLTLDEARFPAGQHFLFACVVERYLALHAGINSFVRTALAVKGREGIVRRFPARAGDRVAG